MPACSVPSWPTALRTTENMKADIGNEDVIGAVGVALLAAALYLIGLVWMLLFLGTGLTGLAVWIGLTRRRRVSDP